MRIWRRGTNLGDRLRPDRQPIEPPMPMVSADPIRMFLFKWMVETGDPIDVVACGFGLDVERVGELLSGERRQVSKEEDEFLRLRLEINTGGLSDVG